MGAHRGPHPTSVCAKLSAHEHMTTFCESPCLNVSAPADCQVGRCLIRHSVCGDRVAIELLFERLYSAVYRHARRICRGGDEAQDLAQETLVLAFEGLAQLKSPQFLMRWMNKIARNRHRERLRISKFAPRSFDEYSDSQHSGFASKPNHSIDHLILCESVESLAGAMLKLPPSLGQAIQLRVLEQLTTRETAQRLATTEMAVRTRLRRARRLLRNSLDRQTEAPS